MPDVEISPEMQARREIRRLMERLSGAEEYAAKLEKRIVSLEVNMEVKRKH